MTTSSWPQLLTTATGHFVDLSHGRAHYQLLGTVDTVNSKPLIVAYHGISAECDAFEFLAPALVDRGYQLFLPDF